MLPWSHVRERMSVARNYWLATVRPDGRPHSVPVWGVWVEDSLHFGGGRSTRKARNLAANPNVVAHSESGEDVVILEGVAEEVTDPALQERIDDAYETNTASVTERRCGYSSRAWFTRGAAFLRTRPAGSFGRSRAGGARR
jgi:hypothetical protein